MSKLIRIANIIAIVIFALFFIGILSMPWPANVVIAGMILISLAVVCFYS